MPKTVVCPITRWPGSVMFSDPMTMPQALAWEHAVQAAVALQDKTRTEFQAALLPGICTCIEKWELEGLTNITPETFPASPREESAQLIAWLSDQIAAIYAGSGEVPDPNA